MRLTPTLRAGLAQVRVRIPWYAFVAFIAIAVGIPLAILGDADTRTTAATVGIFAGNAAAGFVFIRKAQQAEARERRSWTLVGIGFMLAAMGIVVVVIQFTLTGDADTYGPIDLFFLAGYVFIFLGFALLPHTAGHQLERGRIGIDGLIGAVSIAVLSWVLLNEVVGGLAESPVWERVIGSLYPFVDVAIVVIMMIVILRRSSYRFDPRLVLFSAAVVLQAIGDVSLLISGVGSSFADAEPLFLVFLLAAAGFLTTALIVDIEPAPREYADRRTPLWSVLAPYSAAAVMLVVLGARLADSHIDTGDGVLLVSTLLVAILVIFRQALAIRENRVLVEQHRTDLVTSISHELRTPLTAMVGFLSILHYNEVSGPGERAELIGVVNHQAKYLERIVQDLLLLADEDPSRMALTMGAVDVRGTIEHALNATVINHDRVTVEAPMGMIAHVDPERLEQVLVNLITNADRYGGDRCLVRAFARGGTLILEVHDTGTGVPKKHELVIWDRFERGPNRYNASTPGTGIGLAVVRAIAEAHGGKVGYRRSEELGGGCFWIELPGRVDTDRERASLDLRPPAEVEQVVPVTTPVSRDQ
jgi:signal transduction histidine kinase